MRASPWNLVASAIVISTCLFLAVQMELFDVLRPHFGDGSRERLQQLEEHAVSWYGLPRLTEDGHYPHGKALTHLQNPHKTRNSAVSDTSTRKHRLSSLMLFSPDYATSAREERVKEMLYKLIPPERQIKVADALGCSWDDLPDRPKDGTKLGCWTHCSDLARIWPDLIHQNECPNDGVASDLNQTSRLAAAFAPTTPATPGAAGTAGKDGEAGPAGAAGKDGKPGADGKAGPAGKDGKDGEDGAPGHNGVDGKPGPAGKDGAVGKEGPPGAPGPAGPPGAGGTSGGGLSNAQYLESKCGIMYKDGPASGYVDGTDYYGDDLVAGGMLADSPQDCCYRCEHLKQSHPWITDTCAFYSWSSCPTDAKYRTCWVKKSTKGTKSNACRQSGALSGTSPTLKTAG